MSLILFAIGGFMVAATLLPLSSSGAWWIRMFDFPRAHIAIVSAIVALLLPLLASPMTLAHWVLLSALVVSILMQSYWIYPYTIVVRPEVERSRNRAAEIRLMIANVLISNRRFTELENYVVEYDPDMLLVLETDHWWDKQLKSLDERFPHRISYPLENAYGISLHSRFELEDTELRFLVQDDIPSILTKVKLKSGDLINFYGVHPRPPTPEEHDRSTERDAELILIGQECERQDMPVIVAGDLNDVAWSYTTLRFRKISRLLDPRVGRGFFGTFPAKAPFLRWPLDHVFHSDHFRLGEIRVLPQYGSDHLPVFVRLSYESDAQSTQEEPEAPDSEERQEAHDTVEKARKSN